MIKEISRVIYNCDFCGIEITETKANETVRETKAFNVDMLKTSRWYGKTMVYEHFCTECRRTLEDFILEKFPNANGTVVE